MQTTSLPQIAEADLKAAREFLFADRDEPHRPRRSRSAPRNDVAFRHGIARARIRAAARDES
jgi:hypothetical protein